LAEIAVTLPAEYLTTAVGNHIYIAREAAAHASPEPGDGAAFEDAYHITGANFHYLRA